MKTRHIIAIGLLTATAVGLLAIGIKTNKVKPKIQTCAYYQYNSYNYNNKNFTIYGKPNIYNTSTDYGGAQNVAVGSYDITKTTNQITFDYQFYEIRANDFAPATYSIEVYPRTVINIDTNKTIKNIKIYQNTTKLAPTDPNGSVYWYNFQYDFINQITYTDNTTTAGTATFLLQNVDTYTYWLENVTNYLWEEIEITQNIQTLTNTYATGYTASGQQAGDIVDIRGLMLNILTMPFTFISQAFNVTMWEGTPYAINLSNLIKSLIAIATILFIIKLFTSGFSIIGNYSGNHANNSLKRSQTKLNKAKTEKIKKETK